MLYNWLLTYHVVPLQRLLTVITLRPISCGGDAEEKIWRKVVERLSSHAQITLGWFVLRCFVLQAYFVIFLSGVIWIYPASITGKLINFMLYFCNEMRLWRLLHKGRRASASARNLGKVDKVFSRLPLRVFIALSWVYGPVYGAHFCPDLVACSGTIQIVASFCCKICDVKLLSACKGKA